MYGSVNDSSLIDNLSNLNQNDITERGFLLSIITIAVSFILSIVASITASLFTWKLKKREFKMPISNNIHAKRIETYPALHIITDELGAAIRNNSPLLNDKMKDALNKISAWDAHNAIFSGVEVTTHLCHVRRILENAEKGSSTDLNLLLDSLLYLEFSLKKELGIFIAENYDGKDANYTNDVYQEKIEVLNKS